MLYGIGIMLLLLSASFVGGSVIVPMLVASIGIVLMIFGKEASDGKYANTKR